MNFNFIDICALLVFGFLVVAQTSKKDRLSIDPYCLPRLQEIDVSMATAKIIVQHSVPKQKTFPLHSHLLSLNIDTHGSNLSRNFFYLEVAS